MRLIYFSLVVIAIYFISSLVNVVHINTLPPQQQEELNQRLKFRSDYLSSHLKDKTGQKEEDSHAQQTPQSLDFEQNVWIRNNDLYSATQKNSRDYKRDYFDLEKLDMKLPTGNELFILLRSEYIDSTQDQANYRFNLINLPVTTRIPTASTASLDRKYEKLLRKDILQWNNVFPIYYKLNKELIDLKGFKLTYVAETETEFVLDAVIKLTYMKKPMCFKVHYYGRLERGADFLNGERESYILKLVRLQPITTAEYNEQVSPKDRPDGDIGPFMSMRDQMAYVDQYNKSHSGAVGI